MLSKSTIQFVKSLSLKKNRDNTGLFVAEGTKLIPDLEKTFRCTLLFATEIWQKNNPSVKAENIFLTDAETLKKISNQKTPQGVVAVFEKKSHIWSIDDICKKLVLVLDGVQNPGNMGTIVRTAEWFGITDIFCSEHTVDAYSPKVVQATMGALAKVKVHTVDILNFLQTLHGILPIYGTSANGKNIYEQQLSTHGVIVVGNEGNGISPAVANYIDVQLSIPSFSVEGVTESLNVAVATALVCSEFKKHAKIVQE